MRGGARRRQVRRLSLFKSTLTSVSGASPCTKSVDPPSVKEQFDPSCLEVSSGNRLLLLSLRPAQTEPLAKTP